MMRYHAAATVSPFLLACVLLMAACGGVRIREFTECVPELTLTLPNDGFCINEDRDYTHVGPIARKGPVLYPDCERFFWPVGRPQPTYLLAGATLTLDGSAARLKDWGVERLIPSPGTKYFLRGWVIKREVWLSYLTVRDIIAMIEENPEASVANRRAAEALKAILQRWLTWQPCRILKVIHP